MPIKYITQFFIAVVLLFIFLSPGSFCFAQTSDHAPSSGRCIHPDEQFGFADHYFKNGEYNKAAVEYNRFLQFFPDDNKAEMARYRMGQSYFGAGDYDRAKSVFDEIVSIYKNTPIAFNAYFDISRCYLKMEDIGGAVSTLLKLTRQTDNEDLIDRAWYEIGWIQVETTSRINKPLWEPAEDAFTRISEKNRDKYSIPHLLDQLAEGTQIAQKKPTVAGFLSILPGGGYAYCNRYQDALVAFLLNTGLMWAAVTSFEDNNPALGGVLCFVEAGFYTGNIYGGITSAHKYNHDKISNFIRVLETSTRISLSKDNEEKKIAVAFHIKF